MEIRIIAKLKSIQNIKLQNISLNNENGKELLADLIMITPELEELLKWKVFSYLHEV